MAAESSSPLKRSIGRNALLIFVIGDVVGAGIYALIGEVAGRTGGAVWTAFLVALLLALFTALSYSELVTKYPHAGGAALYVNKAFRNPFVTFLITFLVMMSGITSAATLARAFGGDYLGEFIDVPTVIAAVVFLVAVGVLNFRGIKESIAANVALTAVEIFGLLLIVVIGFAAVFAGDGEPSRATDFTGGEAVPLAILGGAYLAFYALIGFEDSANMSEEAQRPGKDYPRALLGGLLIAGVVYVLVGLAATMAVSTDALSSSDGPLLEVVQVGPLSMSTKIFSAIALLAVANGALINLVMASRLLYGMGNQGVVPRIFSRVHVGRATPLIAIVFVTTLAIVLAAAGDLASLADTTVFLLLIVFATVNASLLILRSDRVSHDHFRTPIFAPVLGIGVSLLLIVRTFVDDIAVAGRGGIIVLVGAALFFLTRALQGRVAALDTGQFEEPPPRVPASS